MAVSRRLCFLHANWSWSCPALNRPCQSVMLYLQIRILHLLLLIALSSFAADIDGEVLYKRVGRIGESTPMLWFTEEPGSFIYHVTDKREATLVTCAAAAKMPVDVWWQYWDPAQSGERTEFCNSLTCAKNVTSLLNEQESLNAHVSVSETVGQASLTVTSSNLDDSTEKLSQMTFFCVAKISAGTIMSRRTNIKFVTTPSITDGVRADIDNPVVHQGHTALFVCKINPKNNRHYYTLDHWAIFNDHSETVPMRKLFKSESKYSVISHVENPELHVRQVDPSDFRHLFICVFKSLVGNKQIESTRQHITEIQLLSQTNPVMFSSNNLQVTMEVTQERNTLELPCVASPNTVRYAWFKLVDIRRDDGMLSDSYNSLQLNVSGVNQNNVKYTWVANGFGNLVINDVNTQSSGLYKCVAEYGNEQLQIRLQVHILEKIRPAITPLDQSNKYLSTVQLTCDILGAPISSIFWLHNGYPLDSKNLANGRINVAHQKKNHIQSSVLQIKGLILEDQGAYQCIVLGDRGSQFPYSDNAQAAAGLMLSSMMPTLRSSSQPHIIKVKHGEQHTMWCDFAAEPEPNIYWELDGLDILDPSRLSSAGRPYVRHLAPGIKRAIIQHTFNDVHHSGYLSAIAENRFGSASCNFTILMLEKHLIIRQAVRQPLQAVEGRTFRLSCYVLGGLNTVIASTDPAISQSFHYQLEWNFQSASHTTQLKLPRHHRMHLEEIVGRNDVVISSVDMADAGQYSCVARREGSLLSVNQTFEVLVGRAPLARALVNSTLALEGRNRLTETCTHSNDADAPVLAWWSVQLTNQKEQIILPDDHTALKKLKVGYPTKESDESKHGYLDIPESKIWTLPSNVVKKLPSFMRDSESWKSYVGKSATLNGNSLDASYAGQYICNVLNQHGLAISVKHVKFDKNYEFEDGEPPNQKDVILGQRVNISCRIRHEIGEVPQVEWSLRAIKLTEIVPHISSNDSRPENLLPNYYQISYGSGQSSLIIKQLKQQHKNFLCVTKGISITKSAAFNPNIKLPAVAKPFVNSTVEIVANSDSEYQCHVSGNLPIKITWYAKFDDPQFTDEEKRTDNDFCQLSHNNDVPSDQLLCSKFPYLFRSLEINKDRLFIRGANVRWQGIFRCYAINKFNLQGPSSSQFRIVVIDRPTAVSEFHADESKTTPYSVYLKFKRPHKTGNKPILHYLLEYLDIFDKRIEKKLSETEGVISGLHPGHLYTFKVYAINAVGPSESAILDVSTLETKPTGTVHALFANATHYNQVVLSWKRPDKEHINSPEINYALYFRQVIPGQFGTSRESACSEKSAEAEWQTVGRCNQLRALIYNGEKNVQLCHYHSSLRAFTEYQFRVFASNSKGYGPPLCVTVRTLESAPKNAPSNVSCQTLSMSEIKVSWIVPDVNTINGVITNYQVQVVPAEEKVMWLEENLNEMDTSSTELVMDQLFAYTNYSFMVTVSNSRGRSNPSQPVFCQTLGAAAEPPDMMKLKQSSANCFMASWMHSRRPNGPLLGYTLNLFILFKDGATPGLNYSRELVLTADASVDSNRIYQMHELCPKDGLKQGELYMLQIRTNNAIVESFAWSQPHVVTAAPDGRASAAIVSFSRHVVVPPTSSIVLDCVVVGSPIDGIENEAAFQTLWLPKPHPPASILRRSGHNFALLVTHVRNKAEYVCHLNNAEEIRYSLHVESALPKTPHMLAGTVTNTSVEVQWRTSGFQLAPTMTPNRLDFGYRVLGFRLNFTNYFNGSHTESRKLDAFKRSYLIDPVDCGTLYGFRIAAKNKVGWSAWSKEKFVRAKGSPPIPPRDVSRVVAPKASQHSIKFNFSSIESGDGCAVKLFQIFYHDTNHGRDLQFSRAQRVNVWNHQLQQTCCFTLNGLHAATHYVYRVMAVNSAGNTSFEGHFFTTTLSGERPADPDRSVIHTTSLASTFGTPTILVIIIFGIIILLICFVGLVLFVKRHMQSKIYEDRHGVAVTAAVEPTPIDNPWGKPQERVAANDDEKAHSDTESVDSHGNLVFYATFGGDDYVDGVGGANLSQSINPVGQGRPPQQLNQGNDLRRRQPGHRVSQISSIATVTSSQYELSEAYYNSRFNTCSLDYDDSQMMSDASVITDVGIRRFTQKPPEPEEQRHGTCEVLLYDASQHAQATIPKRQAPHFQDPTVFRGEVYESVDAYTLKKRHQYGISNGRNLAAVTHAIPTPYLRKHLPTNNRTRTYSVADSYGTGVYDSAESQHNGDNRYGSSVYSSRTYQCPPAFTAARNRGNRDASAAQDSNVAFVGVSRSACSDVETERSSLLVHRQPQPRLAARGLIPTNSIRHGQIDGNRPRRISTNANNDVIHEHDVAASRGEDDYESAEEEIYSDNFTVV